MGLKQFIWAAAQQRAVSGAKDGESTSATATVEVSLTAEPIHAVPSHATICSGVSRLARFRRQLVVLETEEEKDVPPAQHRRVDSFETTEEPSNTQHQRFLKLALEPSLSGQYVPEQTGSPTVLETPVPEQSIPSQTGGPTSDKTATGRESSLSQAILPPTNLQRLGSQVQLLSLSLRGSCI